MQRLSDSDIEAALRELPDWYHTNSGLTKTYTLVSFAEAIALVNGIAELAEEQDHHPDMDIRYNRVVVTLSTHDAGNQVTGKDMLLARAVEEIVTIEMPRPTDEEDS